MLVAGQAKWPLFLYGAAGGGKTRASLCLIDRIPESYYCTVERLVRATLDRDEDLWRLIGEYNLVVVDEIGERFKDNDLEYTTLKRAADSREDWPAVWISNLNPDQLRERYDERIYSRLCCGTIFELSSKDRRMS